MYPMRPTLYFVTRALTRVHPASSTTHPTFTRQIRIKTSDDDNSHPPEGHLQQRKDRVDSSLDHPQAQNAKGSMDAPSKERPGYVHEDVNKGDVTEGPEGPVQGEEEAVAPDWWERLKHLLGIRASRKQKKYGSQSGKR